MMALAAIQAPRMRTPMRCQPRASRAEIATTANSRTAAPVAVPSSARLASTSDIASGGESSAKAEVPKSKPISPQDLMATVFHVLDIPQDLHFTDPSGRPSPMIDGGKPIAELV